MKIQGEVIQDHIIDHCLNSMPKGRFTTQDLRSSLSAHGVENYDRASDSILQKLRKNGHIDYVNGQWIVYGYNLIDARNA